MNTFFTPVTHRNILVTVTTVPATSFVYSLGYNALRVVNEGAVTMNFTTFDSNLGTASVSTQDTPVRAGESLIIKKPRSHDSVRHSCATGTTATNFQAGEI